MMPIIIVDDAREDLLLVDRLLRQCKVLNPTRLLSSGRECISYFERLGPPGSSERPCLLLIDLIMTPLDGLQVLRSLKEPSLVKDVALVMMSGLADIKAIQQGYQLGADTFLVKPLNCEDILQMLNALRGLRLEETPRGYVISTRQPHHSANLDRRLHPKIQVQDNSMQ